MTNPATKEAKEATNIEELMDALGIESNRPLPDLSPESFRKAQSLIRDTDTESDIVKLFGVDPSGCHFL